MTGLKVKEILKKTGKSMTEISQKMGISSQALNSVFKSQDVRTGTLERMCDALGLSMDYFYKDTNYIESRIPTSDFTSDADKDRMILLLKGQIMAYEKALGVKGDFVKKNVG